MSYPFLFRTPGVGPLAEEVDDERARQIAKFGDQHHPDGTGGEQFARDADLARSTCQTAARDGRVDWHLILDEEVREAYAESDSVRLRTELLQVIAVGFAWIADIDSRPAGAPQELASDG
jgi:hypothetical protein